MTVQDIGEPELNSTQLLEGTLAPGAAPLPFDATILFKALHYQLLVAIEQGHDLQPEECLWIEALGDVTVPGRMQTEVKHFRDDLTDSHLNFWNTVKNWLHERFDCSSYKALVLMTSQDFGTQSSLKNWNAMSAAQRLAVMEEIAGHWQATPDTSAPKETPTISAPPEPLSPQEDEDTAEQANGRKPSKARTIQQYVLAKERRATLMQVLERMHIAHGQADLPARLNHYMTRHLKTIRPSLQQQYMDDLLGFMFSAGRVLGGWKITHREFAAKLTTLAQLYMKHPSEFPQVDKGALEGQINLDEIRGNLFAQKILEIDGEKYLRDAALHRLVAEQAIADLYRDQILFKPMLDGYINSHHSIHLAEREAAMLDCDDNADSNKLKKESLKFYLARLKVWPAPFCSMNNTMTEFRNGIYHMLADEIPEKKEEEFHWRLWL